MNKSPNQTKASCSLVVHNGKILMLLRDDIPNISYPNTWQHIGGDCEFGEGWDETLLREFNEELSVTPNNYRRLGILTLPDREINMVYVVMLSDDESSRLKLGNEGQKFDFFTYDELQHLNLFEPFLPFYSDALKKLLEDPDSVSGSDFGLKHDESEKPNY